ncbi:MAG: ETC complex I subunit [Alphaproteobacteria bacterium]|nr:ETC complex I subunit [Alphaproteobacteria bacterium]MBO6863073.1 ETC complex I subunit [Alphaproteobacteria bacterium]MEC9266346.1 ETC complex I subunit [Pseudomonadota bacterium]
MEVRIFKPAKTAMQSGRGKTRDWILEFEPTDAGRPDALMGWVGSADTRKQVQLSFDTAEEAISYAEKHGYAYTVEKPKDRRIKPKAYADNFANGRKRPWTH